jgi:uncharacterized lipoprotein YddW (UPF0748 family)
MAELNRRTVLVASALAATGGMVALDGCSVMRTGKGVVFLPAPEVANLAPVAPREFRAAWIASVANIDWPSRKGLSTEQQQAEMRAMLDRAVALRLNAIILQVRTSADALYSSDLEPWSEYLTGTQGQAPSPFYDPLALWIEEAHARGLELHAWFNPFRARQSRAASSLAASHVGKTHPEWVKSYGDQLWIDPGEPAAAQHSLAVFMDVLRRYDVDGIHIDDYFYPYPITEVDNPKVEVDFPDQPAWQRYLETGGTLTRGDWRRSHVDALIERIYRGIRQTKPWVRFGISPFGLGRPELRPPGVTGFSQYHKLYANVERWLSEGWLDYLVPQLYWPIDSKGQPFEPLLNYWHARNTHARHVWAGLYTSRVSAQEVSTQSGWQPREIVNQISAVRKRAPDSGHVHFSMVALMDGRQNLGQILGLETYIGHAVIPATRWLRADPVAPFEARLTAGPQGYYWLDFQVENAAVVPMRWVVWLRYGAQWELVTSGSKRLDLVARSATGDWLNACVVSALDRVGNETPRLGYSVEPVVI